MTATLALLPFAFHVAQHLDMSSLGFGSLRELGEMVVGQRGAHEYAFFFITTVQRVCLIGLFFFMMCVAERTYKQVSTDFVLFGSFSCSLFPVRLFHYGMCSKVILHFNPLNRQNSHSFTSVITQSNLNTHTIHTVRFSLSYTFQGY